MDPVEPLIHSFIVKVWQEVVVGNGDELGWRGYITHVPSGERRYFEDLAEIVAFVGPQLAVEVEARRLAATDSDAALAGDPNAARAEAPEIERTSPSRAGDAARSGEVDMDGSPGGLPALQRKLQDGNDAVDSAAKDADTAQAKLKQARDAQAALQKTVDEAKAATSTVDKAVAAAVNPKAAAEKVRAEVERGLAWLAKEQRAAVDMVVDGEERRGTEVAEAVAAAARALETAQHDADVATAASAEAAAKLAAAQAALKGHGAAIGELTVSATALASAAKGAMAAKRPAAAYRLHQQLQSSLGRLGDLMKPERVAELQQHVAAAWAEVESRRLAPAEAAIALVAAKAVVQEAEATRKAYEAKRDASIDEQLAALERQWAAAGTAAPTTGGSGPDATPEQSGGYAEPSA
jgi:colicin import membrane protein